MAQPYDALAADYDWMFDDEELMCGVAIDQPATARLLERLPLTSAVLDAPAGRAWTRRCSPGEGSTRGRRTAVLRWSLRPVLVSSGRAWRSLSFALSGPSSPPRRASASTPSSASAIRCARRGCRAHG